MKPPSGSAGSVTASQASPFHTSVVATLNGTRGGRHEPPPSTTKLQGRSAQRQAIQLSILAFRRVRPGADGPALDAENRRLIERINARKRVYLTATVVGGGFAIRICVLSFWTHRDRMEMAVEDIRAAVSEEA